MAYVGYGATGGAMGTVRQMWFPANPIERELAWALSGGNFARYFRTVLGAELFVPQRNGDEPYRYEVSGRTFLPVFTSEQGLLAVLGDQPAAATVTSFARLREGWPAPRWWLAINPGLPIEAYLPVTAVEPAARGQQLPQSDPEVMVQRLADSDWAPWPPGGAGGALADAVASGDGAAYLDALLDGTATVPATREVSEGELGELVRTAVAGSGPPAPGTEFPFPPAAAGPEPAAIEAFTTPELCASAHPAQPRVTMPFRVLLWLLPAGRGLTVNPGGPAGLDLAGEQVPLLGRWERGTAVPGPVLGGMRWARQG